MNGTLTDTSCKVLDEECESFTHYVKLGRAGYGLNGFDDSHGSVFCHRRKVKGDICKKCTGKGELSGVYNLSLFDPVYFSSKDRQSLDFNVRVLPSFPSELLNHVLSPPPFVRDRRTTESFTGSTEGPAPRGRPRHSVTYGKSVALW